MRAVFRRLESVYQCLMPQLEYRAIKSVRGDVAGLEGILSHRQVLMEFIGVNKPFPGQYSPASVKCCAKGQRGESLGRFFAIEVGAKP